MAIDDATGDVYASDRLIEQLAAGQTPHGDGGTDAALVSLLADWRSSTEAAPLPALPSSEAIAEAWPEGVHSLDGARRKRGGRRMSASLGQRLTGAAAAVAILVGGVAVVSHNASPGDPLWGVNKSLFSEHAEHVELVASLTEELDAAEAAAKSGDIRRAQALLAAVSSKLDKVTKPEDRVALMQRRDAIERNLTRVDPSPVRDLLIPSVPDPALPSIVPSPGAPAQPAPRPGQSRMPAIPGVPSVPELSQLRQQFPQIPLEDLRDQLQQIPFDDLRRELQRHQQAPPPPQPAPQQAPSPQQQSPVPTETQPSPTGPAPHNSTPEPTGGAQTSVPAPTSSPSTGTPGPGYSTAPSADPQPERSTGER